MRPVNDTHRNAPADDAETAEEAETAEKRVLCVLGGLCCSFAVVASLVAQSSTAPKKGGNPEAAKIKNPVAATPESLSAGKRSYQRLCGKCHGPEGKGDGTAGNAPRTEERAFSFNVDTNAEGNLQRATRDQLDGAAPGAQLHAPGDDTALKKVLANLPSDWSESAWLFLLFLVVLLAEQALAVHLSYHLRGNEAQLPSQAVRPHAAAA